MIVSPSTAHAAGMDVVGYDVAIVGEPLLAKGAYTVLGGDLPVEELGVQFSKLRASSLAIGSGGVQEGLGNEVFFKRDGAHSRYDDARAPRVS